MIGLIIAVFTGLSLTEPERKTIGEESTNDRERLSIWKVLLQPRIVLLCLAASIRHSGKRQYLEAKGLRYRGYIRYPIEDLFEFALIRRIHLAMIFFSLNTLYLIKLKSV